MCAPGPERSLFMPFSQYQCNEIGAVRLPHFEGGDCPRNPKMATFEQDEKAGTFAGCSANFVTTVLQVCAAAAFVSSAKSQCVHPERKDPYLCRVPKFDIKKEQFSTVFN